MIVDLLQPFQGHVRVYLRGGQALLAEHLLDLPEVAPAVKKVRGKAVPESVRGDPLEGLHAAEPALEHPGHARVAQALTLGIDEKRRGPGKAASGLGIAPTTAQILPDAGKGAVAHRHEALLAALAEDPDEPAQKVYVPAVETAELGTPQAAGIQELEDGPVALPDL